MSTVAEIIERQEHNRKRERAHRSVWRQSEWGNLSFLYVESPPPPCPCCQTCDDCDDLRRLLVTRRKYPMLPPDAIKQIVWAGLRAEAAMVAKFQGGNRA
ncbi:hypothetical protein [Lacipirellula limnantheis]|uniref:Uncharacterized protein n=1 Tax=Lacipirellula limnantheis TaxID=2528024 RepID=A0A517U1C7_9BACT|nr:hypothetical protein [Lacipirellula limnantheis]QDT74436.1 hypothetical protein I41_36320 [Lacipirellula limnantheis]